MGIRVLGTRIKHQMGAISLKMYDKFGIVLRIETTVNGISQFKHYREVFHCDGTKEQKVAPVKKTIYSLYPLAKLLKGSNRRYLLSLSPLLTITVKESNSWAKSLLQSK